MNKFLKSSIFAVIVLSTSFNARSFSNETYKETEIIVHLATAPSLDPVYLGKFQTEDAFLSDNYMSQFRIFSTLI